VAVLEEAVVVLVVVVVVNQQLVLEGLRRVVMVLK
jgi:hypothetical protein